MVVHSIQIYMKIEQQITTLKMIHFRRKWEAKT